MDAKTLVQAGAATWNSRDREGFFATYADDCEITAPGFTGKGRQGLADFWDAWQSGFSDNQVTLRLVFAEGDNVVEESVFSGTNDGPLTGPDGSRVPATGRQVSAPLSGLHTVHDGRIISTRLYLDQLDILTQLGLMPES